jgi:hypothetical protein
LATINKGHGLVGCIWSLCSLYELAEAFALASEMNKFITKTKASARWDFGSLAFQISPQPLIRAVTAN